MAININNGVPGNATGNPVASGYVGETINFTPRSIAITNSGTWYNSGAGNPLVTLSSAGVWMLVIIANGGSVNTTYATQVGTGTSGNTGSLQLQNLQFTTPATVVGGACYTMPYVATSGIALYGMAYSLSASTALAIQGYAVRIA